MTNTTDYIKRTSHEPHCTHIIINCKPVYYNVIKCECYKFVAKSYISVAGKAIYL